jgi:tRNA U55 pseudouridine synthase TruB
LVYDIGKKLGVPSYAKELTRTKIGDYNLEQALDFEDLIEEKIAQKIRYDL